MDVEVGVPADASKVRWLNEETGAREEPTVQATRSAKDGDVDILHAEDASFYDASTNTYPTVIYEIGLTDAGWTDPRVWDDRGNTSVTDANGKTQWAKVFATSHRFDGQALVDNGLVRLTFDEPNNSLSVEEWGGSSYSSTSLGSADWELYDFDLRNVNLGRVTAVVEFRDTTQSPTAYHRLSMRLSRGYQYPIWGNTIEGNAVPSGLDTLLDPVATALINDAQPAMGLAAREEVA
jgi:hypothetical protein